jgi:hypothetical protein
VMTTNVAITFLYGCVAKKRVVLPSFLCSRRKRKGQLLSPSLMALL